MARSKRRTIVEWIGPPHFFARGRSIALVLHDNEPLLDALTNIMGPTISPDVAPAPSASAPCR